MSRTIIPALALCALTAAPLGADPALFATPQDALDAMVGALEQGDGALLDVFGKEAEDVISDGDVDEDAAHRAGLLALYHEGYRMVPQEDGAVVLAFGADGWPFPIPLVKGDSGWLFDIDAGRTEARAREIGANELDVIDLLDAYVDVQAAFRLQDHDGDGVMEFARRILSSAEERDGLFWPAPESPVGESLARASAFGFSDGDTDHPPEPHLGYVFRILTAQGDAAPGGAMDYMVGDNMVAGHAILAAPAVYGDTGVHSFMVSENGIILQADLGNDTTEVAAAITAYNPGPDWTPVDIP